MLAALQYGESMAAATATVGLCVALFVLFEKLTGAMGRWAARQVSIGVEPLKDDVENNNLALLDHQESTAAYMESSAAAIDKRLTDIDHYQRYHLGPNSTARPIHERLNALETGLQAISAHEQERKRFQNFLDQVGRDVLRDKYPDEETEG
jgi:hypothetical protein